jgi:transcription elongation factor GreA
MIDKVPITREGLEKLKQELPAKEKQSFLEAKINELEMAISRSDVIEIDEVPTERIVFGTTVELRNIVNNQNVIYQLVGPYESDPEDGKISVARYRLLLL